MAIAPKPTPILDPVSIYMMDKMLDKARAKHELPPNCKVKEIAKHEPELVAKLTSIATQRIEAKSQWLPGGKS